MVKVYTILEIELKYMQFFENGTFLNSVDYFLIGKLLSYDLAS